MQGITHFERKSAPALLHLIRYPKIIGRGQRVGLPGAGGGAGNVLFMDEPFSALDVLTAENLRWLPICGGVPSIFVCAQY